MMRMDIRTLFQVRDGPGDLQYAGMGPGAEAEPVHGPFKKGTRLGINFAELFEQAGIHACVVMVLARITLSRISAEEAPSLTADRSLYGTEGTSR